MNTFKRKSLYSALAGLSALGAAGAAQAVNVNPDGLGQALVYPYYTTRTDAAGNGYTSLLSVVNSTSSAKVVKVRFLEGKNSREVLDFNLFLSAYDVWTAAILPSAAGGGARVATLDRSCTLPALPANGQDFVNYAYSGGGSPNDDNNGGVTNGSPNNMGSLDRTREGYVEIIEMGHIFDGTSTAQFITHVGGVPPGCSSLSDQQAAFDTGPAIGGLFGGMTLINVAAGTDFTADAVALDNFWAEGTGSYFNAGSIFPQLADAFPVSTVFGTRGTVVQSDWTSSAPNVNPGADAVSAVLMHNAVLNEFVNDTGTRSGTDWVVTMPTKRHYVNVGTGSAPRLFQRNFNTTAGSCDDVSLDLFDREEFRRQGGFSPAPPGAVNRICWEANVVTFNGSNVLGSNNVANVPTTFVNGWMRLGFFPGSQGTAHRLVAPAGQSLVTDQFGGSTPDTVGVTYFGLPVVGFAVQSFTNGTLPTAGGGTVLSNYGGNFIHKYTSIECFDATSSVDFRTCNF